MQLTLTFLTLGITILLFITNRVRADLVAIISLLTLVIFNLLTPVESLAGFSNSAVIMIAGLFVVGAGLLRTCLAGMAGNLLLKWSRDNELKLFILLLIIVAVVGAFMSNTGTVALMLPMVSSVALSMKISPSKFLMSLSYIASMSGLMTLIVSPLNLIVSQTLEDNGFNGFGFFTITPIGIIAAATAISYLVLIRNKLLQNEKSRVNSDAGYKLSPKKIVEEYHLNNRLFHIYVPETSKIIDCLLSNLKLPKTYQVYITKIHRSHAEGVKLLPMTYQEMAGPTSIIHPNDELFVQGLQEDIQKFIDDYGLELSRFETDESEDLISKEIGVAEVLLTPQSRLIDETVSEIGFRKKYNLNILGINHKGEYMLQGMASKKLQFGDAILVQGTWDEIELLSRETHDVVVGQPLDNAGVAAASGMAFATPIASPTNSLVLTAGGYKFTDFVRVGVPLQIVMMIVIPLIYPF